MRGVIGAVMGAVVSGCRAAARAGLAVAARELAGALAEDDLEQIVEASDPPPGTTPVEIPEEAEAMFARPREPRAEPVTEPHVTMRR